MTYNEAPVILLLGGTGGIGAPVARQLAKDARHEVKLAKAQLG